MSTGVIVSSGQYTVSSGQIDTSDVVDGGGLLFVDFGGVAIGAAVNSGGTENVFGTDISGTITSSGIENVFFGGVASDATVTSGGNDTVFSGGFASGTVVSSGGTLHLYGGAVTSGTTVLPGGQLKINSGYTISNYVVSSGVYLHIASGGTAVGAVIASGGFEGMDGGGATIGTIVRTGGVLTGGGSHSGTVISTGGLEVVGAGENANAGSPPGGPAVGTIVSSGGLMLVAGGLASNTAIDAGGTTDFLGAGAAILIDLGLATSYNSVLYSVPNEGSFSGAVANNGALVFDVASAAPAKTIFAANLTGSGSLVVSGDGTLVMSGGDAFTGDVTISGGTLELSSAGAVGSGGIAFASQASGTLQIDGTTMPTNLISGFAVGDTVDLAGVTFSSVGGAALGSAGVVTVTEGGQTYTLDFDPTQNFGNEAFTVSADASGGTDVFLSILQVMSSAYTVIAGQSVLNVTVVSGGDLQVSGAAIDTIVSAGREGVYSGGVASDTIVRGGKEGVLSGGLATGTVVSSGGFEDVNPGGTVRGATISAGGVILVDAASAGEPGGTDIGTTVSSGGQEYVDSGGVVSGTVVSSGGFIDLPITTPFGSWSPVNSVIDGVTIESGAIVTFDIFQGGSISNFIVVNSGLEFVHSGGVANDTTVSNGGIEGVQSGGIANGTVVSSGGLAGVNFGGTVSGTIISNGGLQVVGGTASDTTIDDGGTLELLGAGTELDIGGMVVNFSADGSLSGTVVNNGSLIFDLSSSAASSTTIAADITGAGTLVVSGGGHLDVASAYSGAAQIDDASTLEFASACVGAATFSGSPTGPGGTLRLDVPSTGPITVVNSNDTVIAQPGNNNWIQSIVSYTLPTDIDTLFLFAGAQGTGNSDAAGDALYALDTINAQTLTGNSPNDAFVVFNSSDVVVPKAGSHDVVYAAASYTLPTGVDTLFLEGAAAQGTGNRDAAGDALYAANPGQVATLTGNSANDVFVVYNSSDMVAPKAGSHDLVYSAVNYTLPTGVDALILEAGTQAVGNGDAAGDALYAANAGIEQTLIGNSANDTFVVYNSADVVVPKAGSHDLVYSAVNYTLPTGVDSLILEAGTQAAGNSDAAGDTLYAADAAIAQTLTGHSHNDTFVVYNSADVLVGQAGSTDTAFSAVNFSLPTNVDTLFLEGSGATHGTGNNDAVDALFGNAGVASILSAGSGVDTLYVTGTAGTIMMGGAGADTFAFPDVLGKDEVTNFGIAKDTLQFNMTLFSNFTATMNAASQVGANTVFTVDANDTVTLDNVIKTSLTAGNVHFT